MTIKTLLLVVILTTTAHVNAQYTAAIVYVSSGTISTPGQASLSDAYTLASSLSASDSTTTYTVVAVSNLTDAITFVTNTASYTSFILLAHGAYAIDSSTGNAYFTGDIANGGEDTNPAPYLPYFNVSVYCGSQGNGLLVTTGGAEAVISTFFGFNDSDVGLDTPLFIDPNNSSNYITERNIEANEIYMVDIGEGCTEAIAIEDALGMIAPTDGDPWLGNINGDLGSLGSWACYYEAP